VATPISVVQGTAPVTYTLPQGQTFVPEVITAQFNGASAAAAFWPCCSVYSQDGRLLGRFIPPATVAAGDTAEVTYGPF